MHFPNPDGVAWDWMFFLGTSDTGIPGTFEVQTLHQSIHQRGICVDGERRPSP